MGRIRDRATFEALRRRGRRARRGGVTVTYVAVGEGPALRVAYAVGRRAGGAVIRNRVRRRLRAAVVGAAAALPGGAYLVVAGRSAATIPFEDLKQDVTAAMTAASGGLRR